MFWILTRSIAELIGLGLMGSISLRSARIDTVFDYELIARVETRWVWGQELYERQDGVMYRGQDYGYRVWIFSGRHFVREDRGINSQEINITVPREFKIGNVRIEARAGVGRAYTGWENPHNVLVGKLDTRGVEGSYSSNFQQVHRISVGIKPEISITPHLTVIPTLRYEQREERTFWQFKVFLRYNF